eukprot:EG_transcript_33656
MGGVEEAVRFATADGLSLAGRLCPGSNTAFGHCAAVLMHPHPKLGGNQANNVVRALQHAVAQAGFTTLAFDFRGAGTSEGSASWMGKTERLDVTAAVDFLVKTVQVHSVWVVGYSFGAAVAAQPASEHPAVRGYAAVSYPAGRLASLLLGSHWAAGVANLSSKPKFFIIGTNDQFADAKQLAASVEQL